MGKYLSGSEIRQSFIEFFEGKGHTFVPSSSLVPGGDQTLLFTNAGMVQFKDVFLGEETRSYTRAANSQKCMRVAGKHNDLDDVGRDDSHHTFFEMLGNWSFGDYYKKEAIAWAWELLTEVWGLDKSKLWATCFKDEYNEIASDKEAAEYWAQQPGMISDHILYFGRKDNFWEMADTGPCGPCSEIHIDLGPEYCDKKDVPGHVCAVNGDCSRFLELWNLVFMQYNRLGPKELIPLPATHVDTGMGFERIVAVIQGVYSNYKTDLFSPIMDVVQRMVGHSEEERKRDITPYRVIADHSRAAAFLIADGVIPGNTGRNYVCRMIVRRASRFGSMIGLSEPFLAEVTKVVIDTYGDAYPELRKNEKIILDSLTREEIRFHRTLDAGVSHLNELLTEMRSKGKNVLDGASAFDLYATHGLPLEIARDMVREYNYDVDEAGFHNAMEQHRLASGAGKAFGPLGGEDVEVYRAVLDDLINQDLIHEDGVVYDPYHELALNTEVIALLKDGVSVSAVDKGDEVEVLLPKTCFYIESGGQVSDEGVIQSKGAQPWTIKITGIRKPAAGVIVHLGIVVEGNPKVQDEVSVIVSTNRRNDVMRNHTATHLLHAELHRVLGNHARQAGSLVAPDRLRFDFTHPEALTALELEEIEKGVNSKIYDNRTVNITTKSLDQAMSEGATALFGEKYGDLVRTVSIDIDNEEDDKYSYELCGGTHVEKTSDIGLFIIVSEGSAAAGIRRIEAVTGRKAYEYINRRIKVLKLAANILSCSPEEVPEKTQGVLDDLDDLQKEFRQIKGASNLAEFSSSLNEVAEIEGIPVLSTIINDANVDSLREMTDRFREKYPSGCIVLGSIQNDKPIIIAAVTDDLIKRGLHAGNLVKKIAQHVGGGGGGKPGLAQAGGKNAEALPEAMQKVKEYILGNLK